MINLSLADPDNLLLERMVDALAAERIALVAVAGNQGPRADPTFPAAYPRVIAVALLQPPA